MGLFDEVKQNVTVRQAVELYGLKPNRSGLIRCIFHNDKSPSMKVDRRYYCFGCGCTEELWQKKYLRCLRAYLNYRSLLLEWKEQYAPKTWTEEWNEKFMISLSELTVVEYYLDILLFGDRADKEVLVKEKWKEMEKIEQCEREDKGDCYKRTERCHERNAPDGR